MKGTTTSNRLKEIMRERGLKQIDIVKLCEPYCKKYNIKMGRNDVSQYVSGKYEPKQDKLTILGMALNVNEVWLMGFDVPKERKDESHKNLSNYIKALNLTNDEEEDIRQYIKFVLSKRK